MIVKNFPNFNLKQIANSGQIFRMNECPDGSFNIISQNKFLKAIQKTEKQICFFCTQKDFDSYWYDFFDLKTNYQKIINCVDKKDLFLSEAVEYGAGIRILRQDLFEVIISFIISQRNNIPKIKSTIEKICKKFGKEKQDKETGIKYYTFPTKEKLSNLEELQGLSLGYRDKYISKFSESLCVKNFSLEKLKNQKSINVQKEMLKSIYGVGEKVANCVLLFALHDIEAFPIDRWIKKIIEEQYNGDFPFEIYSKVGGVIQQYLFNYVITKK